MAANSEVLSLTKDLLARESITPIDAGCQAMMIAQLEQLGFSIEVMIFEDTTNLWARRGTEAPLFAFAGHTDVVPPGELSEWHTPPFTPTVIDDYLYARGAADMKGSLAAMLVATKRFIAQYPNHKGSLAFLITSDEEGPFINGTTRVVDELIARNELIDMCLVGEPSSTEFVGDVIKNGRRGSLTGHLSINGIQGHVAYPQLAKNPIHEAMPALDALTREVWDEGNEFFSPTSLQISNIHSGTGASNVIPSKCLVQFNLRFSSELTVERIKQRTQAILDRYNLNYQLEWVVNGEPFLTAKGAFLNAAGAAVAEVTHKAPKLSTSGGTSDGRFIAKMGTEVIELGPVNASIHKTNECVKISDLEKLTDIYQKILERVLL